MGKELKDGKKPYKLQLVGLELGGKPIEDYAPDFWLISNENGGDPVGFVHHLGTILKKNKYSNGICPF